MKIFILLCLFSFVATHAQHTLSLQENDSTPIASITDISWISGSWKGKVPEGTIEELWSIPSAGSMMGSFKLIVDGKIKFYEFCTITQEDESLLLRIKHFGNTLHGWEEKEESETFRLVNLTEDKVYFDGLTFERINESEMNIHVLFKESGKEMTFPYKRMQ